MASPARADDLVVNGSFEQPVVADGSYVVTSTLPGWTTTGAGAEIQNNVSSTHGVAFDGNQYVELDSYSNSCMQQVVPTVAGQVYTLSFAYSPRPGYPASTNGIDVELDEALIADLATDGTALSHSVWTWNTYQFTAAGPTTMQFCAVGLNDGVGGWVDDVQVVPGRPVPATRASAVATLAVLMLIAGARAAGTGRARKRVTSSALP
jgi:hypothetical protein